MIAKGWICLSVSPYGIPILFVRKKTGELHMCVDFRALNSNMQLDVFFLPRISDLLDQFRPCYCIFEYGFSSRILIGTYIRVGCTQNSISYKQRPLQIYSNAI